MIPRGQRGHCAWSQPVADLSASEITVTPDTAAKRWRGERMDYETAIDALLY